MSKITRYLVFIFCLLLLTGIIYTFLNREKLFARILLKDKTVSAQNTELVKLSVMYVTAPEAEKPGLEKIRESAAARKITLSKLAHENPKKFLANTLTEKERAQLPKEIKDSDLVEQPKTVQGELVTTQLENFETREVKTEYAVRPKEAKEKLIALSPTAPLPIKPAQNGAEVIVSGVAIGSQLVVATENANSLTISSTEVTSTPKPGSDRSVIVVAFNFLNDKNDPSTNTELANQVFNDTESSKNFYLESSYGKVNLTGRVIGPFTIPFNKVEGQCYEYRDWAIAADTMAYANGINVNSYQHVVYSFPRPDNCWAGAWADIGGSHSRVYIPGRMTNEVISHELGHNLGMYHASFRQCSSPSTNNQLVYNSGNNCTNVEYGDYYDIMGPSFGVYRSVNAPHRMQLGWLAPDQVQTITNSGTYTITPLGREDTTIKTLKIPMSSLDSAYFIEYRTATGFDSDLSSYETSGIQIHGFGDFNTYLLDANMSRPDSLPDHPVSNPNQPLLQDGQTFIDSDDGVTIKLISHTDEQATVEVTLNETVCQRRKPSITISPENVSAPIDQSRTFHVTVTNNDSVECSSNTFNPSVYGEGTVNDNSEFPSLTLTPGQSQSFDVGIHFDYKSTLGNHKITANVYGPTHSNQAIANMFMEGQLQSVALNLSNIFTSVGSEPTRLSALAYDNYGRPIWNNLTYDWGMSTSDSVGTVRPDVNIADFIALKEGRGDLFVTATWGSSSATKSIAVLVNAAPSSPPSSASPSDNPSAPPSVPASSNPSLSADFNHDGKVDLNDYELLKTNFGNPYTIFDYNALLIELSK